MTLEQMIEFVVAEIVVAKQAVKSREQAEACWRGGTDKSWKAVGCKETKAQRLAISAMEARILIKCRHRVEMLTAILDNLVSGQFPP